MPDGIPLLSSPVNTCPQASENVIRVMTTTKRRRGKSLHLELPTGEEDGGPPIAALFLIQFDVKAGSVDASRLGNTLKTKGLDLDIR